MVVLRRAARAIGANEIVQTAADSRFDIGFALVKQDEAQDCDRNAAVVAVGRDQRVECLQLCSERYTLVAERHGAKGVCRFKSAIAEARQAMIGNGGAASAFVIGRGMTPSSAVAVRLPSADFVYKLKKLCCKSNAFCRAVDDLPIVEIAAAAERDDAGADAAERQPDLSQVVLVVCN